MSLLKTNEIQNYNGSSLTLTASTVSTSAQLNTGGNISVTGSLNVSDDSTTRTNLGLGTIATQDSDSITVTGGTATLGALTVSGSDSGDLVRITQTGSGNALVVEDSTNPDSTPFVIDASGHVGVGTSSPTGKLSIASGTYDSTTPLATADDIVISGNQSLGMSFITTAAGSSNQSIVFGDSDDTDIGSIKYAHSNNSMQFSTNAAEQMRINAYGRIQHNTGGSEITTGGGTPQYSMNFSANSGPGLRIQDTAALSGNTFISFINDGTVAGSITSDGSQDITVNDGSDYRLKENINPLVNVKSRFLSLNPVTFNYIGEENTIDGFIAHEVSDIVPRAVTGVKDAVDAEGNIIAQGLDTRKLVPLITAALKEAFGIIESQQSQIDALTARIDALETT